MMKCAHCCGHNIVQHTVQYCFRRRTDEVIYVTVL